MKNISVDGSAAKCMETLRMIISDESVTIYNLNELVLEKLWQYMEQMKFSVTNDDGTAQNSIAFFRLLVAIHKRYPTTAILVSPTTFDYLLKPIIENDLTSNPYSMSSKQLAVYVHCMHLMVTVAKAANTTKQDDQLNNWQTKLIQMFGARHMQHIIARACLGGSGQLYIGIFTENAFDKNFYKRINLYLLQILLNLSSSWRSVRYFHHSKSQR